MVKGLYLLDAHWQRRIYPEAVDRELASWVAFAAPPQTAESIRQHPELLHDVEVIFTSWGMARMDAEFLSRAPQLKAVFHAAGSIRYFATPELWARGIAVSTAHAINALPVAEYALAAILFALRHGWQHAAAARSGGAFDADRSLPGGYAGTVALLSLGAVARLVRERLRPFEVRVIACDPFCDAETAASLDLEPASLDDCFRRADVV